MRTLVRKDLRNKRESETVNTSGAIQYGVPIKDFLLLMVAVI